MSCDELETERLKLRMWRESDLDDYAELTADPLVMRYLQPGKPPFTRADAWRSIAFFMGHWQMRGYGHWAVEEKASGRMIGRIGFLNPEGWPGFEIGWTLARHAWGKGYATEGGRRALDYAFKDLDQRPCHQPHSSRQYAVDQSRRASRRDSWKERPGSLNGTCWFTEWIDHD